MNLLGTLHQLDDSRGAVRVENVYDTDIDDLWESCTDPDRLARWIAEGSGDLREGGTVEVVFTSTWAGPARIDACDAPRHLLMTMQPGTDEETQVEAWLTAEGSRCRLVVEERGLPVGQLHFYGSGWQAHLEDLRASLAGEDPVHPDGFSAERAATAWHARWTELTATYEHAPVA
ncbi:SRPBCC family protein [Nocardioides glacieisoli]|uniref:SRPBCC family protein n=1 Tax=Nocardioides glacieisoli TaxID=1168730 RepID=A0A4Q2RS96_9ACTN|nr:SRPBCC family protein [Nocardioides glacieisoli]RYB90655.1 SRPBCC family protein [Nocardioides glacieisoli]